MCTNIDDDIPLSGAVRAQLLLRKKQIVCDTMLLWRTHHMTTPLGKLQTRGGRARYIPLPLGKLHRHVVPGTQYDACVVPGISWSLGKRVSFYRFIVSLSFCRYRYRYTEIVSVRYFLSYRFQTIIPKLSVRYPSLLFSCPCIGSAQITPIDYVNTDRKCNIAGNTHHRKTAIAVRTALL